MAPASSMDQVLPVEILVSAFKLLEDKDRCRLCLVSRRLQAILYHAPELWKRLDLSNRYTLGGDKFIEFDADHSKNATKILRALFATKRKELSTATIMLPSFARFSTIMRLDLSCTGIDPSFFSTCSVAEILASSLAQLILSGCPLVNSGSLYHLHTLKSLSYLDISHCEHVDDVGLEVLGFFVNWIKELNLGYLFKVTEVGVKKLLRMSGLRSLNLMGCCKLPCALVCEFEHPISGRIKSYPWAITNVNPNSTVALRELSIGEDSRIQTRGFWLLWCTWQHWDMRKLSTICPFLETLRLNMVLFDLPADGLQILLDECKHLKVLSLVIERNTITTLCGVAEKLRNLKSLDLTVHIGIQGEQMESLIAANALPRLKALKFHSKHTNVFNDTTIAQLIEKAPIIEYLELNGDELTSGCLGNVVKKVSGTLQSLLLHHVKISNTAMKEIAKNAKNLRDLTISDLQVDTHGVNDPILGARTHRTTKREMSLMGLGAANKLRWLVSDAAICMKLKKIELASYDGFCDKDLAEVPKHCVNLQ
ncbi:RNI-like protein [Rhizoclosmatium globosum]|uniref:RNI-like protein n=1 Tax=Rhizoclosmatium globosum TaxID=329046 RepID=A0A1Y2D1Q6_9FUNG|nr:RNI-like protein [Rhizoclosmatium globosum]|eukprot:ORY53066.1 RNI-like protein [Rhizoclosmatium globosum]